MKKHLITALILLTTVFLLFSHCYHQSVNMPVPIDSFPCGYGMDENGEIYKWIPSADKIKEV